MSKRTITLASVFGVLLIALFAYLLFFDNIFSENTIDLGDDQLSNIVQPSNVDQDKDQEDSISDFNEVEENDLNDDRSEISQDSSEEQVEEETPNYEEQFEEPEEEETNQFNYVYEVESVEYQPNSSNYGGFKICDLENSTCTVYGVEYKHIAKAVLGGRYILSFNQLGNCKAALGTAYCLVEGDLGEVSVELAEPY